ncbi:MAG: DUF4263 domain-containing protein [Ignavibacteriae bacterium]|nr:DUF4263 domain-containing protein [Ignavibacteriota bacterium]
MLSHHEINIRKFLSHHFSLFPNNYLWHSELSSLDLKYEAEKFREIIYSANKENEIQKYIKDNRKWFIPASIYKEYNFAHHGAYLFPEMALGKKYNVDYCLIGKNSDGYHVVFTEFENPDTNFKLESINSESESVRKGLAQIRDWKRWIDSNRDYFLKANSLTDNGIDIPSHRFHYCLIVSRRDRMDKSSYNFKSQLASESVNLKIATYDRLVENILKLSNGY